ncbi:CCA tRNA nucleotidyltransferase [Commensalibacter melissae]|uniref:CCA tRNA nucleotidyltransferase n=1 Tax=Commensalibacter melissae TaxID=2070537 RepID=UPI0018DDEAF7|nr:CCA tRNA nucleotidyltransferase [Commensalibacter melissae]MBH9973209.1 CCA tRNA nucleotidyltransferase [Commensalibacter melissae]
MNILDKLPDQSKKDLKKLWDIFPNARLVGGVVRDLLVQKSISDIDIATMDLPDRIIEKLSRAGIKGIPTGIEHGTVTAIINHHSYEITTLRKDIKTDGRHAKVVWTQDWQEDAARRDFTINALYCDKNGKLWDYFHGQEDLSLGHVRFVGTAHERIAEDFLRILRYFRFYARYGKTQPDLDAVNAIQFYATQLDTLSAERVWSELRKIITGPRAGDVLNLMDRYGVLTVLMPFGYRLDPFVKLISAGVPDNAIIRLSALIKGSATIVAKKFKLSSKDAKFLSRLEKPLSLKADVSDKRLVQLKALYSLDVLIGQSWLEQIKHRDDDFILWDKWRKRVIDIPTPVFPVKGKDLIELGVEKGPIMGKILESVKIWWIDGGCYASALDCIEWLKRHSLKNTD